jgi:hypothetical protein
VGWNSLSLGGPEGGVCEGGGPPSIKPTASEEGNLKANGSESTETAKEEGMGTDPPPYETENNTNFRYIMETSTHT